MLWVYTTWVITSMANIRPRRNLTVCELESHAVRTYKLVTYSEPAVAFGVFGGYPYKTSTIYVYFRPKTLHIVTVPK